MINASKLEDIELVLVSERFQDLQIGSTSTVTVLGSVARDALVGRDDSNLVFREEAEDVGLYDGDVQTGLEGSDRSPRPSCVLAGEREGEGGQRERHS